MSDKKDGTPNSEAARMKERSLDGSTLKANAEAVEEMKFDVLPWEVPLKVVFTDEEPQPLADEGEEADEPPVECAAIRVVKRGPAQALPNTYRLTVRKTHEPKTTKDGNPYISASAMYSRFVGETEERRTWVLITAFGATAAKALLQVEPGDQGEFTGRLTTKMGEYDGVPQRQWYLAIGGR